MADVKLKVKRIGVLSLGMYFFFLYLIIGLLFGALYGVTVALIGNAFGAFLGTAFSLLSIFIMVPLIGIGFGIIGFILGALSALIFNFITRMTNGVEIRVEEVETQEQSKK